MRTFSRSVSGGGPDTRAPRPRLSRLTLMAVLGAVACGDPGADDGDRRPEPTDALRSASARGEIPGDSRVVDYVLNARLDGDAHRIEGTANITWRNRTDRAVTTLPFHLYANGFRAEDTAWVGGSDFPVLSPSDLDSFTWGYIDVGQVQRIDGESRTILSHREDAEPSTMEVALPTPVGPGESIELELSFVTQLPKVYLRTRTTFDGDFHMAVQWFPKLAVLEEKAGWKNHTFVPRTEFYADFGNYDVSLDVPESMVVGASGIRTEERVEDGRKRLHYRAEMVHDFAWVASPDFVERHGEYQGIRIRQLMPPDRVQDAPLHLEAQIATLESMEARFGPYPWSTITIVHPPRGAGGVAARGMEYPTLFTTGTRPRIPDWVRTLVYDDRRSGVGTTVHEFGHQYFQGILASNEYDQPWLDEGMNSMSNVLAYEDWYGPDPWYRRFFGHGYHARDRVRSQVGRYAQLDPVDQDAGAFSGEIGSYGALSYRKTVAIMITLRNLVGAKAFDAALEAYAQRYRFRHPTGAQLEATIREIVGDKVDLSGVDAPGAVLDLGDYFEQALRQPVEVDFSAWKVTNRRRRGATGWHRDAAGERAGGSVPEHLTTAIADLPDEAVEGVVVVHRRGGFRIPVAVDVTFADGTAERLYWDGRGRHHTFSFPGKRVAAAAVDADESLWLESRRLDNVAYAPGHNRGDGLSAPAANGITAMSLATLGVLGP